MKKRKRTWSKFRELVPLHLDFSAVSPNSNTPVLKGTVLRQNYDVTVLVAAYLIEQGKSPAKAVEFIKTKRPSVHLRDAQKEVLYEFSQ
ncbi:MAG: hypothetical protein AAB360_02805 [Patescibacteria group bacterium]